jgi:hypothetical protein
MPPSAGQQLPPPAETDFITPSLNGDAIVVEKFRLLQQQFIHQFRKYYNDWNSARTVVIIPSLSLDQEILSKISGMVHYEERLLCLLMLLRKPRTRVIYVTSTPIDPVIIDYYLHLLPGITSYHAMQRLTMLSCFDSSRKSLTEKILERPRLMERIRRSIPADNWAHLTFFNMTSLERELAVKLNLPVYGCDPNLLTVANKSGGRKLFRESEVPVPSGFEDLRNTDDLVNALAALKEEDPLLKRAVVKMEEGFSGEGNAIFSYENAPSNGVLKDWVRYELKNLRAVANGVTAESFLQKFNEMGGIAEAFIEGSPKKSPSVQCRINPVGEIEIVSTHDQHLGGEAGQVYQGAIFPANEEYNKEIGKLGYKIAVALRDKGVVGRFGIDFLSVKSAAGWQHYAIEINLRKGGTTHPFLMLQYLTDGSYDHESGIYSTFNHQPRFYYCSDNLYKPWYRGLTPHDLIEIAMTNELQYNPMTQEGVMFHIIGALSEYGKLGVVCIGRTKFSAYRFYKRTVEVLDQQTNGKQ